MKKENGHTMQQRQSPMEHGVRLEPSQGGTNPSEGTKLDAMPLDTAPQGANQPKRPSRRWVAAMATGIACATLVAAGAGLVHAWTGPGAPFQQQVTNFSEYTSYAGIEYRIVPLGTSLGSPILVELRRLDPLDQRMIDKRTGLSMVVDQRPIASVHLTLNGVGTDLVWEQASGCWEAVVTPSQVSWFGSNQWMLVAKTIDGSILARFERKISP